MTGSADAYEAFAHAYDKALGDLFFASVSRQLERLLTRYPSDRRTHLDVACGTGQAVEFFERCGFTSIGVDASTAMLALARRRAGSYVAGDMRALPLRGTFERVTCLYDSLNHLLEKKDLLATFRAVARVMSPGALFWFDVNHPSAYPLVWGETDPFESKGDDYLLEMHTSYSRSQRLGTAVVKGWSMVGGEKVEIEEIHHQRPWSERDITALLREAKLKVRESFRFHPFGRDEEEPVKIFFVCERS